ncbi:g8534 [Coccomyxa elongata]
MIEIFLENVSGSFPLEGNGHLNLISLKLDPITIRIQGRRSQVGPGHGQGAEDDTQLQQKMYEAVQELKEGKTEFTLSISEIGASEWAEVVDKAELSHDIVMDIQASTPKETVPAFDWYRSKAEHDQSERYMHHLKQYIQINNAENGWVDAAKDPHLLSFAGVETLGFNFKGTTDVMVASCQAIKGLSPNQEGSYLT